MDVRFRAKAKFDLENIATYYSDISDQASRNVLSDIQETIETLRLFPKVGRLAGDVEHRRIVTPRYRYVIIYTVSDDYITIIGVFRFQHR